MQGKYIQGSPTVELLSNESFVEEVRNAVNEDNIYPQMYTEEFIEISSNIGFILPKDDYYIVNKCHEIYEMMSHPHSDMLLGNRLAIGILHVVARKKYIQCVPMDLLVKYTGYSVEDVEDKVQLLENLKLIEKVRIIDGSKEPKSILKNSAETVSKIQMMRDKLNENESITTDELQSVLEVEDNQNETVLCVTEDEFVNYMQEAINTGNVNYVDSESSRSILEEGDDGYRMNDESTFVQNIDKMSMVLIDDVDMIQDKFM